MDPDQPIEPPEPQTPATEPESAPLCQEPDYGRHIKGKIGRLPKTYRDKLNFMLLDGVPHAEIPARLGEIASHITRDNVDKWAAGAYKLWLARYNDLQATRAEQETAMDLACPEGGSKIHEGTLQLAATRLSGMVRQLDCSDFKELLRDDPAKLIPFLNALATISNAEIKCERHRRELGDSPSNDESDRKGAGLRPETRKQMEGEMNLM